jgi:hypothetical protein
MRILLSLAAASAVVLGGSDRAAAQKHAGPALEVRVRSVNDLLDKAEYIGEITDQGEVVRQVAALVRGLADEKRGIEGVDPTRPFGLYGSLTPNVIDSPVVLMVPIADEQAFLDLLTTRLGLDPKKGDDGVYQVALPDVPVPVFFRFAHRTAYIAPQTAEGIETDKLIAPKEFFAAPDDAVASARLHLDRLPADVKKTVLGQFELRVSDAKDRTDPGETPAQKKLRVWALDRLTEVVQLVLADGKELAVRLAVDPKSDALIAELTFSAKDGTELAKALRGLGGQSARAAALAGAKSPVAAVGVRLSLPEKAREDLAPVIDALITETLDNVQGAERQAFKIALGAVTPTLKSGELDAGLTVTVEGDHLGLAAAVGVMEGDGIEKTVKLFGPFVPEDQAKFEFDVRKAGGLTLHRVVTSNPDLKAAFGTGTIWLGTSDRLLAASIEPDGKSLEAAATTRLEKGMTVRGPVAAEVSVARLLAATEKGLPEETVKRLTGEAFPDGSAGKDTANLTVEGGDALKIRFALKGKAVKLAVLIDQEKKK